MNIVRWRKKIDKVDRQLVKLLNKRAGIVQRIGDLKRTTNLPIREPQREAIVMENIANANTGPLTSHELQDIYSHIMEVMRGIQVASRTTTSPATHLNVGPKKAVSNWRFGG